MRRRSGSGIPTDFEQFQGARPRCCLVQLEMKAHRFGELALDREERIQARHRILEYGADIAAEHDARQPSRLAASSILPSIWMRAGGDASRLFEETHHGVADGGLAGAGFADERVDLARLDDERGVLDGRENAAVGEGIFDPQAVDGENGSGLRVHRFTRSLGLKRSRSQSPTMLTARTRITRARAGKRAIHQMPENTNSLPMRMSVPSEG